jgi:hypothetical protein
MTPDLFDWTPPPEYPDAPGWREPTTSRDAAEKIKPVARTLRDQVLEILRAAWPAGLTADEVAAKLGKTEFSIRPRFSELRKLGLIGPVAAAPHPSKKQLTRPNASGVEAIVWVCSRPEGDL